MNTRRILKIVAAVLTGITSVSVAAEGRWTQKADMPTARFGLTSSVVNGRIYAIGGATGPGIDVHTVEEYDPMTDSWTKKADMLTAVSWYSASVVNGKIYAIGGATAVAGRSTVQEYDPAADIWKRKADMPTPRWALSTSAVSGRIYAIGGASEMAGLRTVEEYDPTTNNWTRKADMPTPRILLCTSVVDGVIYAIGGSSSQGGSVLSTVEAYDPATNTWTIKAPIPTARCFFSTTVVNGKIYAIGGCANPYNGDTFSSVEAYDPSTDTWTQRDDMPTPRKAFATSAVNGKIYAIGGNSVPAFNTCISTVEQYDPNPLVVDFNGDFKVDFRDLCMLAQYWYQEESPLVNHRVDYEYLAVLADYWLKEVLPVSLVAYWRLDETEGNIAHDSAGDNDGILVIQNPLWRPLDGQVDGALELDGLDDFVLTDFVLDPGAGPLSVFAWVKGGAPGQVIISQSGGANWLMADASEGNLMTELQGTGRFDGPLCSQAVITDGDWHRVGITWDGSNRILYVDDVEVAGDTQTGLAASTGGPYFGAGQNPVPATLWFGLLDDVKIYDRAIVP